jgi:phosphatidate cytidylyltransferase
MENELRKRIITGAAIGAVIIGATLAGTITSYILVYAIVIGSIAEFEKMHSAQRTFPFWIFLLCLLPIGGIMPNPLKHELLPTADHWKVAFVSVAFTFFILFIVNIRASIDEIVARLRNFGAMIFLFTIPGIFAIFLCTVSPRILLGIFILIWSSDIFAYFIGKAFGKHKLAPSISPKKTWEGFIGGSIATVVAAWGFSFLFDEIKLRDWLIIAALVAIFGTVGDLLQSAFKRSAGVKDSGSILPGHGGIWDRFDSFLGCLPWVGGYYLLIETFPQ